MGEEKKTSLRITVALQCALVLWLSRMLVLAVNTGDMDIDHAESLRHAIGIATITVGGPLLLSIVCVLGLLGRKRFTVSVAIIFDTALAILLGFALASDCRLLEQSLPATGYHAAHVDLVEHLLVFSCSLAALSLLIRNALSRRASLVSPTCNEAAPHSPNEKQLKCSKHDPSRG